MRSLAADRQASAVTQPPVAADIHQTLDVHLDPLAEVALDITLLIQQRTYLVQVLLADIADLRMNIHADLVQYRGRARFAYTIDVGHSDLCPFVGR